MRHERDCETREEATPRYVTPRILLVDIDDAVEKRLKSNGFNVTSGSFGFKYKTPTERVPCQMNGRLRYLHEQDIVIVNLLRPGAVDAPSLIGVPEEIAAGQTVFVSPRGQDYFDPTCAFARDHRGEFQAVLQRGGVLVVFAAQRYVEKYYTCRVENWSYASLSSFSVDNYSWLPVYISATASATGREIIVHDSSSYAKTIAHDYKGITYECTFQTYATDQVLFRNSSGQAAGFLRRIEADDPQLSPGLVIVLPQFDDLYVPIANLLTGVLPDLKPEIVPDLARNAWLDDEDYMFPAVKKLLNEKNSLIEEYNSRIAAIETRIAKAKDEYGFLTAILTAQGTGNSLKDSVRRVLNFLGYVDVVDVDELTSSREDKQEDLQIRDGGRLTIIEVKGIKGNPTDDDLQALVKYMSRRMRESGRTDLHGILVVNHKKLLPPLKREDPAFTPQQIEDAISDHCTLVSTWDLFQAARLFQEKFVSFDELDRALHTPGLFRPISQSWKDIGSIEAQYHNKAVVGLELEVDELHINDELIVQDANDYFRQRLTSMRIDDRPVDSATKGDRVSIQLDRPVSKRARIYFTGRNEHRT